MSKRQARPDPATLGLSGEGIDTHAHLDLPEFDEDRETVLGRAAAAGVVSIGNVFLGPAAFARGRTLFANHPEVFFLLGIHPHDASTCTPDNLSTMERFFADEPKLLALGETGLDFFYDRSPREVQLQVFRDQLVLARERDLPVVVHSRDAFEETISTLDDLGFGNRPLLWHCFGGDKAMARTILDRGWLISIPGTVTYGKSLALREAVTMIPPDRMVLETDCPFLAPEPYRGKRNEPAFSAFTAAVVAHLQGSETDLIWKTCAATARAFFRMERCR
jgi:TatD DNase family protein